MVSELLSAHFERFSVSHKHDFFYNFETFRYDIICKQTLVIVEIPAHLHTCELTFLYVSGYNSNTDKSVTHRLVVVNFAYFRDGQFEEDRQGMAAVWERAQVRRRQTGAGGETKTEIID